mgnify:CR=1 FL=1
MDHKTSHQLHKPMPDTGRDSADILRQLDTFKGDDPNYKDGRLWSLVYYLDEEHSDFLKASYHRFACENGLNPTAFKSLKKLETEVISATADIMNGTEDECVVVTNSSTESNMKALKTYHDITKTNNTEKKKEQVEKKQK